MRRPGFTRGLAAGAAALASLLGVAGAAPAESRYPELAPAGRCAEPWPGYAPQASPFAASAAAALAGAAGAAPAQAAAAPGASAAGRVVSLSGSATAVSAGSGSRPLACGDPIYTGERIVTGDGASAGLLVGDVLAQLAGASAAALCSVPGVPAQVALERGELRVVDPREAGSPAQVAALGAQAQVSGNDVEVRMRPAGSVALCAWRAPLSVERAGASAVVEAGACAIAGPRGALASAPAPGDRIPVLLAPCEERPPLEPLAHLRPLPPVAAGEPVGPEPPEAPREPPRSPCEVGCARSGGGVTVQEQPPSTDPFPGSGS